MICDLRFTILNPKSFDWSFDKLRMQCRSWWVCRTITTKSKIVTLMLTYPHSYL